MILARSDARHVVVLAQIREVLIQLLHPLLVRLNSFALETFVEL